MVNQFAKQGSGRSLHFHKLSDGLNEICLVALISHSYFLVPNLFICYRQINKNLLDKQPIIYYNDIIKQLKGAEYEKNA